jgi:sigma-54-specific transcriptional regulator
MALQVKLLRVLQERQVVRLGSRRSIPLDVRLVAATNIDLARAVEAQHFRADLYYRLSVAAVRLPPLRERPADIVPLARHFIAVYSTRLNLSEVTLSDEAQAALLNYSWPGNIRELENVIHFALIVCRDEVIGLDDIKLVPLSSASSGAAHAMSIGANPGTAASALPVAAVEPGSTAGKGDAALPTPDAPLAQIAQAWRALLAQEHDQLLDTVESVLVHTAFEHAGQNQVRTAKALGITRNMLRTLLKRHGLLASMAEEGVSAADTLI